LNVKWWLPTCYEKDYKKKPFRYFSHTAGHEGENSLLSYLISEGLALELSAGEEFDIHAMTLF